MLTEIPEFSLEALNTVPLQLNANSQTEQPIESKRELCVLISPASCYESGGRPRRIAAIGGELIVDFIVRSLSKNFVRELGLRSSFTEASEPGECVVKNCYCSCYLFRWIVHRGQ